MQGKIVIGTANFFKKYGFNNSSLKKYEIKKIINFCKKNNLRFIDTAFDYELKKIDLKNFKVITKIKLPKKKVINFIENLENKSRKELKKLNSKSFYSILIHNLKDLNTIYGNKYLNTLKDLKKKGIVKKIGVSIYNESELIQTLKFFRPEIIQFPLNIFNQNILSNKMKNYVKKKKILLQARSIFLQGFLLLKNSNNLGFSLKKQLIKNHKKFVDYCYKKGISQLELCVNFIKSQKYIDLVTFGIENETQIKDFINLTKKKNKVEYKKFNINDKNLVDPRKWKKKN